LAEIAKSFFFFLRSTISLTYLR